MINPNTSKQVIIEIKEDMSRYDWPVKPVEYKGHKLEIYWVGSGKDKIKAGKRKLYLKYSIVYDKFYLSPSK